MNDWKEGLTRIEQYDAMMDLFYRDLESWFSAVTFYCDSCVDDFIKKWPGIYNRDLDFQRNFISLDVFYSGGRIQDYFTKEEFLNLSKDITCPNCGDFLSGHMWPYDLRFDVPDDFDSNVCEIADIAEKTPFLLMLHPFSQEIYNEIEVISKNTDLSLLSTPLYRARVYESEYYYVKDDFLAAPKKYIKEGRYNHAGKQVLYLGEDALTCYLEVGRPQKGIMLGQLEIQCPIKILDLMAEDLEDNDLVQAMQLSSLMSSPGEGEGWYKPHYVFTRFVTDAALSVGFDAIRYPSVRSNTGNNIVILNYEKLKGKVYIIDFNYISEEEFLSKQKKQRGF
ncbi:hypothetical protein IEC_05397 [Bacillus toyonensis]|uniref:RES family NAD+ phosphorylase n=1 Tax=Bacillus toyonensis TaxID=155322 RepID=UPI000278BEBD|nr:RES family NAD+ phosphorylase [Bacillus toyonensis]EJQ32385.1 hypothetical protein IEC_05397 [Bacillus toyonensis]